MKLFLSSLGTSQNTQPPLPTTNGGLFISFDDNYAEDWLNFHNNYGKSLGWKATFYTIKLYEYQIPYLQELSTEGHEIGNHTENHFDNVPEYMQTHTAADYYNAYVKPMEDWLISKGIPKPTSFRFPRIIQNKDIIADLFTNRGYKIISPAAEKWETVKTDTNVFYNGDKMPVAFGLPYNSLVFSHYKEMLDYAKANNRIFSVMMHGVNGSMAVLLAQIIAYANEQEIPMYKASELYDVVYTLEPDAIAPTIGTLVLNSQTSNSVNFSCTATDNDQVVGYDLWLDDFESYIYYYSSLSGYNMGNLVIGNTYTLKVRAFDKKENRSGFSNTLTFTIS